MFDPVDCPACHRVIPVDTVWECPWCQTEDPLGKIGRSTRCIKRLAILPAIASLGLIVILILNIFKLF